MVKPARERIARLLSGSEPAGSFSTEMWMPADGLSLSVNEIGRVPLPIGAAQEKDLVSVARQAMFGRGEETFTDPSVRDTWELTADQVALGGEWDHLLDNALIEVHDGLGLPRGARLRAELHALLVYGKGQFFAPHQDSEKDDEMVATLVVSLPSVHTGGELLVSHSGETRTYRHLDRDKVGFLAFYADCVHEVRPVRSGRRVTMTFNLLLTREHEPSAIEPDAELADLLTEHFTTPVTRSWSARTLPAPDRLVVLLDHQYSQRSLAADRLKGRDVEWVATLRAAAQRADCVTALGLAEIKQTWNVFEGRSRSWRHYEFDDEFDEYDDEHLRAEQTTDAYEVGELIEDEVTLAWWKRAGADHGETITLFADGSEVCAITATATMTPYESEYEGYMGNYGNTLDRWYRRATMVIWPNARDFAVRADADLAGALAELRTRLRDGEDLDRVREDVRSLMGRIGAGDSGLLPHVLPIAEQIDDAESAAGLLRPLSGEGITVDSAGALAGAAARYGKPWLRRILAAWFPDRGYYPRPLEDWTIQTLPALCRSLAQADAEDAAAELCRRIWISLSPAIRTSLDRGPAARASALTSKVPVVEALLNAADPQVVDEIVTTLAAYDEGIVDLTIPLLRRLGKDAPPALAADVAGRLEAVMSIPPRAADDWSIAWSGCGCELCDQLQRFLDDSTETKLDWPLRTDGRRHVHSQIDSAELPVRHHTIRKGRPYTLHLAKLPDLHRREAARRAQAEADLTWLAKTL